MEFRVTPGADYDSSTSYQITTSFGGSFDSISGFDPLVVAHRIVPAYTFGSAAGGLIAHYTSDTQHRVASSDGVYFDCSDQTIAVDLQGWDAGDVLKGGSNSDILSGDGGADQLSGRSGADTLNGGTGSDLLRGGSGNDALYGNDDNDILRGRFGLDNLQGGNGMDRLNGGGDSDRLSGGADRDVLIGGAGSDTFVLAIGDGRDRVVDFQIGADSIDLSSFGFTDFDDVLAHTLQRHAYTAIVSGTDVLVLRDIHKADLIESDFTL